MNQARKRINQLAQDTEGNFSPEDVEGIYSDADRAVADAQLKKCIAWVLEWLWNEGIDDRFIFINKLRQELKAQGKEG